MVYVYVQPLRRALATVAVSGYWILVCIIVYLVGASLAGSVYCSCGRVDRYDTMGMPSTYYTTLHYTTLHYTTLIRRHTHLIDWLAGWLGC